MTHPAAAAEVAHDLHVGEVTSQAEVHGTPGRRDRGGSGPAQPPVWEQRERHASWPRRARARASAHRGEGLRWLTARLRLGGAGVHGRRQPASRTLPATWCGSTSTRTIAGLRTCARTSSPAPREQPTNDVVEYLDGSALDFGKRLRCRSGPPGNERIVFTGLVSALEVSFTEGDVPVVAVLAEDDLMKLRLTQRSAPPTPMHGRRHRPAHARRHGLKADVDADGPTYDVVQQFNQSDLAFLRERARRIQAELWATEGSLHLATRDRRPGTSVTLTRGSDLIVGVGAGPTSPQQCTAVQVSGYDAAARARIDAEAPAHDRRSRDLGRAHRTADSAAAFGALPGRRVRDVPVVESEARAVARAEMLRRCRRFVQVRGTTTGHPGDWSSAAG